MNKLLIIIIASILCFSCGVKKKPEYESEIQNNINIYKI